MTPWIKLTFTGVIEGQPAGDKFDINADLIAFHYPRVGQDGTNVFFGGDNDDYIVVQETPEQILKLINDPEFVP